MGKDKSKYREFQIDMNKLIKLSKALGVSVVFKQGESGVFTIDKDGNEKRYDWDDFFSELKKDV